MVNISTPSTTKSIIGFSSIVDVPSSPISKIPNGFVFPKSIGCVIAYPTRVPTGTFSVCNVIVRMSPSFTFSDDATSL